MAQGVTTQLNTLNEALYTELTDLYGAEKQLVERLPTFIRAATDSRLRTAIEEHLDETRNHVIRIEEVFKILGRKPEADGCKALQGLFEEIDVIIATSGDRLVKDAVLIGALQRIEHYEIAGYGTARAFAEQLGLDEVVDLLQETLNEESFVDRKLTGIAEGELFSSGINSQASHAGEPRA